jgi:GGDEF domain-containing protein
MDVIQNRFHKILAKYNEAHDHPWKISASIGIAYYDPNSPISLDDLLRQADEALYQNKNK